MVGEAMTSELANFSWWLRTAVLTGLLLVTQSNAGAQEETAAQSAEAPEAAPSEAEADTPPPAEESAKEEPAKEDTPKKPELEELEPELPFEIRPYRVMVTVSFNYNCLVAPGIRDNVIAGIQTAVRRMYGQVWETSVEQSPWIASGNRSRLERLNYSDFAERYTELEFDKVFAVTIAMQGNGFQICCRECDTRIHELTPVYAETVLDDSLIPATTARLLRDSFRPNVLFLRNVPGEDGRMSMVMQVQAGELVPPDPSAVQVVEGDVLRPFIRQMDRRNPRKLKQLKPITLTYLKVLSVDREVSRGQLTAFYLTHLRPELSPFGGKGRSQQHMAIRQRPTASQSQVKLVLQSRPDKPLISHRLALAFQLHYKDEEDGDQIQLVSDRNGEVTIKTRENHPTFWIRVYSGSSLLARVPYSPGLIPYDVIKLPDDSIRLGVEGELQLLADDLIDAIALRGVLLARARKEAAAGKTEQVEDLFERYDQVPSKDDFLERISNIRIPAATATEKRGMSPRRINGACQALESTVKTFFSDEKRAARAEEIQKVKQLAEQKAQ